MSRLMLCPCVFFGWMIGVVGHDFALMKKLCMDVTVRCVVQVQSIYGEWTPFLRFTVNGDTKRDINTQRIAGTTDLFIATFKCPRNSSVVSQLGTRRGSESVYDIATDLGWIAPRSVTDDCFITCKWGGPAHKLYVPAGRYVCLICRHSVGRDVRVCAYTTELGPSALVNKVTQKPIRLKEGISITPLPHRDGERLVFQLADVMSGEREEAKCVELPAAHEPAVFCQWGDSYTYVTEVSPAQLCSEKAISPSPTVPVRKVSRSEPLIGILYTPPNRAKTHQSSCLCNVENERFDSLPPADMKGALHQRQGKKNSNTKFLAEYTKMNRSRIKEHQRTLERKRMWGNMKKSVTNCCVCCSRERR